MSPVEVEFTMFFPALLALYWLGPRTRLWQNSVVLIASYLFFLSWSGRLIVLLLATTGLNFWLTRRLPLNRGRPGAARALFWVGISLNLVELAVFKYEGFFASSLNELLTMVGLGAPIPVLHLVAAIGLSFRTLQNIAFLADVYLGRQAPPVSLLDFASFTAFFPQMLAGPIARGAQLLPQFAAARNPDPRQWSSGAATFLLGFALKAFAADAIGEKLVNPVFGGSAQYGVMAHWLAVGGFALQIFADFGGYSLIAIGIGRLLGLELPINFNYPFASLNLPELWRRWHITLNAWLFDYIFVPLTVSTERLRGRMIPAFFITFGLSGLWHGASWPFVIWGLLQAAGLSVHHLWEQRFRQLARHDRSWVARRSSTAFRTASWLLTMGFFVVTLVPFRSPDLASTLEFARRMITPGGDGSVYLLNPQLLAALGLVIGYQLMPLPRVADLWQRFTALPPFVRGMAYGLAIAFLLVFTPAGSGTFIYAQF